MGWLRLLTGMRNGLRGARSSGGMLLVMMALAGLLTQKPTKGTDSKRSSRIRQGYATGIVTPQPASFGRERHGSVGGTIEPPDGPPRYRIPVGRLMKQAYQSKCHCLCLVGH